MAGVLAPYRDSAELPSLFERYLLDVDDADEAAISARLDEVKRYWDKQTEHARYGATIRALIEKHPEAKLTLGDPRERERLAEAVREKARKRVEEDARAVREWDELLGQMVESAGGLDPLNRARLEKMAASTGIDPAEARAKLDAAPVAAEPEALDGARRAEIAQTLTGLARQLGEPRAGLSLFHAYRLELTADRETLLARYEEQAQANRVRGQDNTKSSWDSVLSLTRRYLLDGDPRVYVHGLMLDVREALELRAIKAVADDGEIDEIEAAQLLRDALELGLTDELAEKVVAELAREHGAGLRTGAAVDFVACPSCNRPHPRADGAERCERCGAALFVECPGGCGRRNDATAARCGGCGADLHRYSAAIRVAARLPELLDEGHIARACEELEEAVRVLGPDHEEVESHSRRVAAAGEAAKRAWGEVEAARAERRSYAARRLLGELEKSARDVAGPAGELPGEALESTRRRIAEAEDALEAARGRQGEDLEAGLLEALALAADCAEAERALERLPVEPPAAAEAVAAGGSVKVRWTASATDGVGYLVQREEADGRRATVGETELLEIEDRGAAPGSVVRYAVEAVRGRARSATVLSAPLTAVFEVSGLNASAGDGEVRLSWKAHGGPGRIAVTRREEGDAAETPIAAESTGATDLDVVNGRRYTYRVQVEYPGAGEEPLRTPGLSVFAQPVERPEPVRELSLAASGRGIALSFEQPSSGAVAIFRLLEDPGLEPGEEIAADRLAGLGEQIDAAPGGALDSRPPSGHCFYQAVTIVGDLALAGAGLSYLALPEISKVRAVANGRQAKVTWQWPEDTTLARVVWRHDRQPEGPRDGDAEAIDYRLGEYRDRGGCEIELGERRALFVAVYPAARVDGEVVYGSAAGRGARAALRTESKTEMRYSVRCSGVLRKRLEVDVREPAEGELPSLVLVGREGEILPRSASDGTVLARLGGAGPRSHSVDLRGVSRPLAVRLFLDSAGAAGSFVLFDPMADELRIA